MSQAIPFKAESLYLSNCNIFPAFRVCGFFAPTHGLLYSGKSPVENSLPVIDGTPGTAGLYQ